MRFTPILALFIALVAAPAFGQVWTVGEEREVDEGYYFTLLSSEQGWRVWQIETREGTRCTAIKSAEGRPHPEPLGVQSTFWRGTPFLVVSKGNDFARLGRIGRFRLRGVHGNGQRTQFRLVGDRFWTDWSHSLDLTDLDGERIEVAISSYEYSHSLVGGEHERGVINLAGLARVVEAVEACGTLDY